MTRSNWILAGIGGLIGIVSGIAIATVAQRTGVEPLPAVSAGIPPKDVRNFTDRDLIEKLLPPEPVIYYQFVDQDGDVRFVPYLHEVPLEWLDQVGFVEVAAVPQTTPAGARMIRKLDGQRDSEEINAD